MARKKSIPNRAVSYGVNPSADAQAPPLPVADQQIAPVIANAIVNNNDNPNIPIANNQVNPPNQNLPVVVNNNAIANNQVGGSGALEHFEQLVRGIVYDLESELGYKIGNDAILAVQAAAEDFLVDLLADANLCAIHGGRKTVNREDMELARQLRRRRDNL